MKQKEYKIYLKNKYSLSEEVYNRLRNNYRGMKGRCLNIEKANYYGLKVSISLEDYFDLWNRDKAWLLQKPSIDRKDPTKGYTSKNCRFIELSKNCGMARHYTQRRLDGHKKRRLKNCKPVLQLDFNNNIINIFFSIAEAKRQTNIDDTHISSVCTGKRTHAGGFVWRHV